LGVGAIDTDVSSSLINMDDFRAAPNFAGIDGSGFSVVVIDTGIDLNHPFFGPDSDGNGVADRIVYDYDFADGDAVLTMLTDTDLTSLALQHLKMQYTGEWPPVLISSISKFLRTIALLLIFR
jgi:subtilisin family serine protease